MLIIHAVEITNISYTGAKRLDKEMLRLHVLKKPTALLVFHYKYSMGFLLKITEYFYFTLQFHFTFCSCFIFSE